MDKAITGVQPAELPSAGLLPTLDLKSQTWTSVGYGSNQRLPGNHFVYDGVRRVAISDHFLALTKWLKLSMNPARGDGGTCYGDSGGPNFVGSTDVLAAVTVTGDTPCTATNVDYRLDTPSARDFLDDFVTLP